MFCSRGVEDLFESRRLTPVDIIIIIIIILYYYKRGTRHQSGSEKRASYENGGLSKPWNKKGRRTSKNKKIKRDSAPRPPPPPPLPSVTSTGNTRKTEKERQLTDGR